MKKIYLTIYTLFFFTKVFHAQQTPVGARSAGMGNASICNNDVWASFNNQAGLAFLNRGSVGIFYENRFLVKELGYYGLAVAVPFKGIGTFGLSFNRMGYSLFNRNKASFVYAQRFGDRFSAAIQFNYLYTFLGDGYGSASTFTGELGLMAKVTDNLSIGFHLNNPVRMRLASYNNERLPTVLKVGLSYQWVKKLITSVEFEKDVDLPVAVRGGLEYKIVEELMMRVGGGTGPIMLSFGAGIHLKGLRIDVAGTYHQILGLSPQASVSLDFGKPIQREKKSSKSRKS